MNGWALMSHGDPYLAFLQQNTTLVDWTGQPSSLNPFKLGMRVKLDVPATRLADDDEIHPFLSFLAPPSQVVLPPTELLVVLFLHDNKVQTSGLGEFSADMVGALIIADGLPSGTTIISFTNVNEVRVSNNATISAADVPATVIATTAGADVMAASPALADLIAIGVTPSGKLAAITPNAGTLLSSIATLTPDCHYHDIRLEYSSDGHGVLYYEGNNVAESTSLPLWAPGMPRPLDAPYGRFMLFNSSVWRSRLTCRIQQAYYEGEDGRIDWSIEEGSGPDTDGVSTPAVDQDFMLSVQATPDALPWGGGFAAAGYNWIVVTEYTRVLRPITFYTRIPVSVP